MMYFLIVPMTLFGALGAFFFKRAAVKAEKIYLLIKCPQLYIGCILYAMGAIMNIILLRYVDYSIAYPMTAVTYVWTALIAHRFLGEMLSKRKLLGIAAIILGVLLLAI